MTMEHMGDIKPWISYMLTVLNPAYAPGETPLKIMLADVSPQPRRGLEGDTDYKYLLGEYQPDTDLLFVKIHNNFEKEDIIHTLVHEMAHRVHLERPYVALNCRRAYAGKLVEDKNAPGLCRSHGTQLGSGSSREYLMTISDAVHGIIYLGIPNDAISYDEALVYNKMILDMRIQISHENASESPVYDDYIQKYGIGYAMTNYLEFWAEASVSYLYKINKRGFPSRDWIEKNHSELYKLLREAYQDAPSYTHD